MKPPSFDYVVADTVDAAVSQLHQCGSDAKLLAGGQSLVPLLNFRLARPSVLVDINRISRLADIRVDRDSLRIGALARHRRIETSPTISEHLPILGEAAGWIAHPQIRNRGTIGGALAHSDASAELPVVLTALDATVTARASRGDREIALPELTAAHLVTTLSADEMIVEVRIPRLPQRTGSAFQEFSRRHGDYAIGGAAAVLTLDERDRCIRARITVLGGGNPADCRRTEAEAALVGTSVTPANAHEAAEAAVAALEPTSSQHGDADYRREVIATMTRRAIDSAARRARSTS